MSEVYRETGMKMISEVFKNEKNRKVFEKNIWEHTEVPNQSEIEHGEEYLFIMYQICGDMIIDNLSKSEEVPKKGTTERLVDIKQKKFGWNSTVFENISKYIEEYDEYLVNPFEVVEGVSECHKCHSKRTWSVQKQTRGGDEPMTTFSKCVDCGNRWVYSG
jgi:DNA-directed RNA polymerase subunit M/transcription elongation factor TFIIS